MEEDISKWMESNCYMGVVDCYYSPGRTIRTLVMSGMFTPDDLMMVHVRLVEEGVL